MKNSNLISRVTYESGISKAITAPENNNLLTFKSELL